MPLSTIYTHTYCIAEKFSLGKKLIIFTKPRYLCIAEIFSGINFRQCGEGCHILYVIINTEQIKISPTRAGGKIGENFFLVKIFGYTVHAVCLDFAKCSLVVVHSTISTGCKLTILMYTIRTISSSGVLHIVSLQLCLHYSVSIHRETPSCRGS